MKENKITSVTRKNCPLVQSYYAFWRDKQEDVCVYDVLICDLNAEQDISRSAFLLHPASCFNKTSS